MRIGYIVGSLSRTSVNRQIADLLVSLAPTGHTFSEIAIGQLPLFDTDLVDDLPQAAVELKEAIESMDAVVILTPEHNRSLPAALKNAIDFASAPLESNAWSGKEVAVLGATTGRTGTAVAQSHLRAILSTLDARVLGQPEMYLHIDPGHLATDTALASDLRAFLDRLAAFITPHP